MSAEPRLAEWEGRSIEHWRAIWQVPRLLACRETASTNDLARNLAFDGAPAGTLVLTEHQTAGRGRMQRAWSDRPGCSLLLSFLLRPGAPPPGTEVAPGTAPIRVGMATAVALRAATGIAALVKWPNDIVVGNGLKLAGILCEAVSADADLVVIAGIGINVRQREQDWPPELRTRATSVAQLRGDPAADRTAIMSRLVPALHPLFAAPLTPLSFTERDAFTALDALAGRVVSVSEPAGTGGTAAGLDADGALLIRSAAGTRRITAGTVRPMPAANPVHPRSP